MANLDFPNSPNTGFQYTAENGVTYEWTGDAWEVVLLSNNNYYTETEVDALLANKSDTGHTHVANDITDATDVGKDVLSANNETDAREAIKILVVNQSYYDSLSPPDSTTLYFIEE